MNNKKRIVLTHTEEGLTELKEVEVCVLQRDYKKIKVESDIFIQLLEENIIFRDRFDRFNIFYVIREEDLHLIEKLKIQQKIEDF